MKTVFFALALLMAGAAGAATLPGGSFRLEKGTVGCPAHIELLANDACQGFTMKNVNERTEIPLCNINNGKFIKRWSEEGIEFREESKTLQQSNLLISTKIVRAAKAGKTLRESRTNLTLFFRAGRLDLQQSAEKKSQSCLYGRDPGFSLSAGSAQD